MPAPDESTTESEALLLGPEEQRSSYPGHNQDPVGLGPVHGEDTAEAYRRAKDLSWQHIQEKSYGDQITEREYLSSMMEIDSSIVERWLKCQPGEYSMLTTVKDVCFFLQLALHVLGAGKLLGYPPRNPNYLGVDSRYPGSCIPAMFSPGNQIPYIVIHALMKQAFFKDVIRRRGDWQRPSEDDAVKLVLYQTVVEPQLMGKSEKPAQHPPSFNILTALRNLLVGSDDDNPAYAEMRDFQDLELGHSDNGVRFPSATELNRSGVKLINKAGIGISNIRFKNWGYSATLDLPTFHINTYTVDLLTNLVHHELSTLTETDREVTSYVRFMRDLAPTYKDFKILLDRGVIQVHDEGPRGTVIHALHQLVSLHRSNFTPKFNEIMRGIKEYETVPWHRISFTCSIACGIITFFLAVFTIVQTLFTILSYYYTINPPN